MTELGGVSIKRVFVLGKWLSFSFHRVERGKFIWENGVKLFHPNWYLVIAQQLSDGASSRLCR